MRFRTLLIIVLALSVSGCATSKKTKAANEQIQALQARVNEMEVELKDKQDTIDTLEAELEKMSAEMCARTRAGKEAGKPSLKKTPKNIQRALKNAKLYTGSIDGRIGKNTKNAIREFQKLNGLKADGIVGKRTWAALKKFLQ